MIYALCLQLPSGKQHLSAPRLALEPLGSAGDGDSACAARGGQRHEAVWGLQRRAAAPCQPLPAGGRGKSFSLQPCGAAEQCRSAKCRGPRPGSRWASGWHSASLHCRLRQQGEHGDERALEAAECVICKINMQSAGGMDYYSKIMQLSRLLTS